MSCCEYTRREILSNGSLGGRVHFYPEELTCAVVNLCEEYSAKREFLCKELVYRVWGGYAKGMGTVRHDEEDCSCLTQAPSFVLIYGRWFRQEEPVRVTFPIPKLSASFERLDSKIPSS